MYLSFISLYVMYPTLQLFFTTFINRDNAYHALFRIWQNALLGHVSIFFFLGFLYKSIFLN